MWPISQRFLDTLSHTHALLSYVQILQDGAEVARIAGGEVSDPLTGRNVQSLGGKIDVSRSEIRRSGNFDFLNLSDANITADQVRDLFAYLVTEIRPFLGVQYWDATPAEILAGTDTEYVPIGTIVVTNISGRYPALNVSGFDRMFLLNEFEKPYVIPKGTNTAAALAGLLSARLPANRNQMNLLTGTSTTGAITYDAQVSARSSVHDLAASQGWVLSADPMGTFVTVEESGTTDPPLITYQPGPRSVMMRPIQSFDASQAYNAVVYTGEATDIPPVRGYAEDTNPASPTYVPRVGVRPLFASSPLLRTAGQAQQAAQTRLKGILGIPSILTLPVIPNPAIESGDVFWVIDPDQGIDMAVIADAFPVGMRASDGQQDIVSRSQVIS